MMSTALRNYDRSIPEELRSPAYQFLQNYHIDAFQFDQIFQYWFQHNTTDMNFYLREATCRWVAENLDLLTGVLQDDTYPRVPQVDNRWEDPLYLVGLLWAIIATLYTLATGSDFTLETYASLYTPVQTSDFRPTWCPK